MKRYFLTGLLLLLPLSLTIWIASAVLYFLSDPFLGLATSLLGNKEHLTPFLHQHPLLLLYAIRLFILLALFLVILLVGFLGRLFFLHTLFRWGEQLFHRIPFISMIYKTTQQILHTLLASKHNAFKQVVLVPFPSAKHYTVGLVAGVPMSKCQQALKEEELLSVLIPSSPNPITGFILMFKKSEVTYTSWSVEEALKWIISCGVINTASATANPQQRFPFLKK